MFFLIWLGCQPVIGSVAGNDAKSLSVLYDTAEPSSLSSDTQDPADPCESVEEILWTVAFPQVQSDCPFGINGNLTPSTENQYGQNLHSVRLRQVQVYNLSDTEQVCAVKIPLSSALGGVQSSYIRYEDHLVLTMNDRVIFSTTSEPIWRLQTASDSVIWDWKIIVGTPMEEQIDLWWMGDSLVSIPNPGEAGALDLQIDAQALDRLTQIALAERQFNFTLITLGDNDPDDCQHSGLSFDVVLEVVK